MGIRCVDSENKSLLLPNHDLLPLIVFALNHVQPTSHAPPATASVNQRVAGPRLEKVKPPETGRASVFLGLDRREHVHILIFVQLANTSGFEREVRITLDEANAGLLPAHPVHTNIECVLEINTPVVMRDFVFFMIS